MQSDEGRLARAHRAETELDYPARADYPPCLAIENSTGAELNWVYTSRADESLFGHFDFTTAWGPARDEPRAAQSLMRASTMTGEAFTGSHVAVFTRPAPPTLVVSPHSPRADTAGEQKRCCSEARRGGGGVFLGLSLTGGFLNRRRVARISMRGRRFGMLDTGGNRRRRGLRRRRRRGCSLRHGQIALDQAPVTGVEDAKMTAINTGRVLRDAGKGTDNARRGARTLRKDDGRRGSPYAGGEGSEQDAGRVAQN